MRISPGRIFRPQAGFTFINRPFLFSPGPMRVTSSPDTKSRPSFKGFRASRFVAADSFPTACNISVQMTVPPRAYCPTAQRTNSRRVDEGKEGAGKKDERAPDYHGGGKKGERTRDMDLILICKKTERIGKITPTGSSPRVARLSTKIDTRCSQWKRQRWVDHPVELWGGVLRPSCHFRSSVITRTHIQP